MFDPKNRRYHADGNCYFYEDFSSRINSLRHYDSRRVLLKRGIPQTAIVDGFEDDESGDAVRNLFVDPDSSPDILLRGLYSRLLVLHKNGILLKVSLLGEM